MKAKPAGAGERFGKLTVFGAPVPGRDGNYLPCLCDCGVPVFVLWRVLNSRGRTQCGSCRVARKQERLYRVWSNMKSRCHDVNLPRYSDYGGRGISVCDEWQTYMGFSSWAVSSGYDDTLTIERLDNDGNYCPDNCAWVTVAAQSANRRNVIRVEYDGETKILAEWARDSRCAVSYAVLYARFVQKDWEFKDAISSPARSRRPQASE